MTLSDQERSETQQIEWEIATRYIGATRETRASTNVYCLNNVKVAIFGKK